MSDYFVVRSLTSDAKWTFSEIVAGRLRQGWYADKRMSLVDRRGRHIAEETWIKKFLKTVHDWKPEPKTQRDRTERTAKFARQKYRELSRLLDVTEGALLIVPKLDSDGGDEGIVLARAVKARGVQGRPAKGCYWFDLNNRESHEPQRDYRHVVAVDPDSVCLIPRTRLSRQVFKKLEKRRAPVVRSLQEQFNEAVEAVKKLCENSSGDGGNGSDPEERQDRERIKAEIMRRRGQTKFRVNLLHAYGNQCAISGCDAKDALEAAHIRTHKGADINHPRNGIILRADLHTLFDLYLISVQTSTWSVLIAPQLKGTTYDEEFKGKRVTIPANDKLSPKRALDYHQKLFKQKLHGA